jgi:ribosomal RNA-processing protein 8
MPVPKKSSTCKHLEISTPRPQTLILRIEAAKMFAVPGWNVSASLATQTEKPKPRDPAKEGKKAQKKKKKQQEEIDAGNVGEYWDKVMRKEGGKAAPALEAESVKATVGQADEQTGEGAEEKRGKKRKRGPRKPKKEGQDASEQSAAAKQGDEPAMEAPNVEEGAHETAAEETAVPTPLLDTSTKPSKKKRKKEHNPEATSATAVPTSIGPSDNISLLPEPKGLTPLQKSMRQKLASARFRHLNEALYTKPSAESLSLFKDDPSMFEDYHRGFAQQVEVWPENPVDSYVSAILARGKVKTKDPWKDKKKHDKRGKSTLDANSTPVAGTNELKPLPRNMKGHATIADLGCGTASLSYRLQPHLPNLNLTFHSFDLSKPTGPSAPLVTVADISALPLAANSVDVAVFCLALMGTNWLDFIDEAYRVLRWRGELWISEIKSRFGRVERRKAGTGPINSIGSLKKSDKKGKGKKKGDEALKESEEGIQGSDDEAELATRIDGVPSQEGTDVSAFVAILAKRGFVLDAPPERPADAVDLSNKMFVKLQFVKGAPPSVGKNVRKEEAAGSRGAAAGSNYNPRAAAGFNASRGGLKMGMTGKKYKAIADADADGDDGASDGKVLKPCLYKIR